MKKRVIKIEYLIEDPNMSDDEYENQEFKDFYITEEMLYDIVCENTDLKPGQEISTDNFFIVKI